MVAEGVMSYAVQASLLVSPPVPGVTGDCHGPPIGNANGDFRSMSFQQGHPESSIVQMDAMLKSMVSSVWSSEQPQAQNMDSITLGQLKSMVTSVPKPKARMPLTWKSLHVRSTII
jgi:hypothetical protein